MFQLFCTSRVLLLDCLLLLAFLYC
jgi:hypothetical protein